MNRNLRYLVLFLFVQTTFWAQETAKYSGENAVFFNAEELFTKAQYASAKREFNAFINQCKSCLLYTSPSPRD